MKNFVFTHGLVCDLGLLLLVSTLAGCTTTVMSGSDGGTSDISDSDAIDRADGAAPARKAELGFVASNVNLSGIDPSGLDNVSITGNCAIDASTSNWDCVDASRYSLKILTQSDGSRIGQVTVRSLQVESTAALQVRGSYPVVFVSLDSTTILGTVQVAPGKAGGYFNTSGNSKGSGPGGGPGAVTTGNFVAGSGGRIADSVVPVRRRAAALATRSPQPTERLQSYRSLGVLQGAVAMSGLIPEPEAVRSNSSPIIR